MRLGLGLGVDSITSQKVGGAGFTGILDEYSGAAAAYSTRQLKASSTLSMRVRRSSNDAEQDIGFDANGDLDTTALLAFVNAEHTLADEDFSSSTGWNLGTGLSITDGVLRANTSSQVSAYKNFGDPGAQQVRVTFTVSNYVSGNVKYLNFGTATIGTPRSANGTYTETLTLNAGGNMNHGLQFNSSFVGDIDDFEIVQITADGAVTTFYDQSGNGNHATNSTASEQPLVVSGGSVVTENGKAAIDFDGVDDNLQKAFTLTNPVSHFVVAQATNSGDFVIDGYNVVNVNSLYTPSTTLIRLLNGVSMTKAYTIGTQAIFSSISKGTDSILAVNGSSTTQTLSTNSMDGVTIGAAGTLASGYNLLGTIQEVIIFNSDQSSNRTGMETNINDHFNIYP